MRWDKTRTALVSGCLILAALALAGCFGSGGQPAAEGPERPPAPAADDEAVTRFGKYDPPITISVAKNLNDSTVFKEGESLDNNVWSRDYERSLGIRLQYAWAVKGADEYKRKANVAILAQELPDIFEVDNIQLKRLVNLGLIEDLTAVYGREVSSTAKRMIEEIPNSLATATFDGKLMAIPQGNSTSDQTQVLWVRYDWLQRLGLPEPRSFADVRLIAEQFATADPDGNQLQDTIGLGISKGLHSTINIASLKGFFNGFHAFPGSWVPALDGSLVFGGIQPEIKQALQALQELYAAGALDREFAVKDQAALANDIIEGKVGMQYGAWWNPTWPLQASKDRDPEADWRAYGIPSADERPALLEYNFPIYNYYVVRKGFAHPEALAKLLNLMVYRGYEQKNWEDFFIGRDGFLYNNYPMVVTWPENGSLAIYAHLQEALATGDPSQLNSEEIGYYEHMLAYRAGDHQNWFEEGMYGTISAWRHVFEKLEGGLVQYNRFYGAPTATAERASGILDKITLDTYTQIIMGELPVDAFDDYVQHWLSLGGQRITDEVNAWADSQN